MKIEIFYMRFWLSVVTLVGTIVGVGIFGLPAVIAEAGWGKMTVVVLIGVPVVMLTHMSYAHVVLLTLTRRRLAGYAREWLGKGAERLALLSQLLGLVGSSLAYLLVGGIFLTQLIRQFTFIPDGVGIAIYFIAGAVIVWRGVRSIAETELIMVAIMLGAIVVLGFIASPQWEWARLVSVDGSGGPWRAYGVLLFSLWGMAVIPEAAELVPRRQIGKVVVVSVLISFFASAFFVLVVMGVANSQASEDALTSLVATMGMPAQIFGYAFGVLATFTSYLTLSRTTVDMLQMDLHQRFFPSFIVAMVMPLLLLMAGVHDFVTVIAVTGAVSLGLEGVLSLLIERKAVAAHPYWKVFHIPSWVRSITVVLLAAGIFIELLATFGVI